LSDAGFEREGYAIEWIVKPPLWVGGTEKEFQRGAITVFSNGEKVRAETIGTSLSQRDFEKQAKEVVERVISSYILTRSVLFNLEISKRDIRRDGKWHPLLACKAKLSVQSSSRVRVTDAEGNVIGDSEREAQVRAWEITNRAERNETLKDVLKYYLLASREVDRAGNLYKAMEELWNDPRFGNVKELSAQLKPFDSSLSHNKLKELKRDLNRGRHAFVNGKPTEPIPPNKLVQLQQDVRRLILAYVKWLKANEPLSEER